MTQRVREVLVIGLDGAMSYFIKRFAEEGLLPNIHALMNEGVYAEALPCPPTDTPTNWTTIATGARTRSHGVTSFYIHVPGEPYELGQKRRSRGQLSKFCKAEYLWTTADRHGIPTLVLNYPAGWPGNMKRGYVCLYTWPMPESVPRTIAGPATLIFAKTSPHIKPCEGLGAKVGSREYAMEVSLPLEGGLIEWAEPVRICILKVNGKYRLAVQTNGRLELLDRGKWSSWITAHIRVTPKKDGVETRGGMIKCIFKVKLLDVSKNQIKIERSGVYTTSGWISPGGLEEEVIRETHYLEEEASLARSQSKLEYDISGEEAQYLMRQRLIASRLARMASFLKTRVGWKICFLHYHILDGVNHRFLGYLHKDFPYYSEERAEAALNFYREAYRIVDEFVGKLIETCATPETLVVLVSDHAALPAWRTVNIRKVFLDEGLLKYRPVGKGRYFVDWASTRAFPWIEPLMVWVNLEGRDPDGIVKPREYEDVREEVIDVLQGVRDPETGQRIATMVVTREESWNIGMGDERTGDVVFFLKPPYTIWWGPIVDLLTYTATSEHLDEEWLVRDQEQVTGIHGYYLPNEAVEPFTNSSMLIMKGPGLQKGLELRRPVELVDVAPTISHLLGMPPPRDNEGRIIHEALQ